MTVKKKPISKLFLYRHRFIIGYILLGLAFLTLLFSLPLFTQQGLSEAEIESATSSYYLNFGSVTSGDLVDLPYRLLQKSSIAIFGLTAYSIKLPSILIGLLLGILLILILNRWFKNNVSLLASCLVVLSTPFLYLAGSGTPLIMLVFWPTFLLWLGSKIQGEKKPKPLYSIIFALALLLAVFTPYMVYFAIFCVVFSVTQPHLRFVLKSLPKIPLIITALIVISGLAALIINIINNGNTITELLTARGFTPDMIMGNLKTGLRPLLSWRTNVESIFLSPLISLPTFAIALIGLFSTTKGFFASRNSIASLLLVFTLVVTSFRPDAVIFFILPLSILTAHGLRYILEKWYGLFPENPYARVSAIFPLIILFGLIIIPSLSQYIFGYHYNPNLANSFTDELSIVHNNLQDETLLVPESKSAFYRIIENSTNIKIITSLPEENPEHFASLGKLENINPNYQLSRIITSAKSDNSDIIYLYTAKGE
jgi:hypothetical protein